MVRNMTGCEVEAWGEEVVRLVVAEGCGEGGERLLEELQEEEERRRRAGEQR